MDGLRSAVLRVSRRMRAHRNLYEKNEEAVKQHLLGEIFQALGWDWNNPEEVRPEERTEDGRADYALILNGSVFAFVEAKNLGVNILKNEGPLRQLGRYCFNAGVRYGILTNGAVWIVIKAFEEGSRLSDRVLLKVNLEAEPLERSVLKLSFLSKDGITGIERRSSLLKALELSFSSLKKEGYPEEILVGYLTANSSNLLPIDEISETDTPKAAYVYENGWKLLPLQEQSIRGVLLAVLMYMERRASEPERSEIRRAYEHLRALNLPPAKAFEILKTLEEEEKLRISVEL
jgi:hypothetical protein